MVKHRCPRCKFKWRDAEKSGKQLDLSGRRAPIFRRPDLIKWHRNQGNLLAFINEEPELDRQGWCVPAPTSAPSTDADAERLSDVSDSDEN